MKVHVHVRLLQEAPYFYTYKNSDLSKEVESLPDEVVSEEEYNSNSISDNTASNQSGSSSVVMATVATCIGVLIVAVVSVFGVVAWKRNHSNKEEREILLQPRDYRHYAPI